MMFANTVDFRLSLDFFDSGLYTRTAVARLTLALAKLSCFMISTHKMLLHAVQVVTLLFVLFCNNDDNNVYKCTEKKLNNNNQHFTSLQLRRCVKLEVTTDDQLLVYERKTHKQPDLTQIIQTSV